MENRVIYEVMWKNIVHPNRPQMTIWRIACWIPKDKSTHSDYVILFSFCHCYNGCINVLQSYVTLTSYETEHVVSEADCCGCGNEPSDSIFGEYPDHLRNCWLLKNDSNSCS